MMDILIMSITHFFYHYSPIAFRCVSFFSSFFLVSILTMSLYFNIFSFQIFSRATLVKKRKTKIVYAFIVFLCKPYTNRTLFSIKEDSFFPSCSFLHSLKIRLRIAESENRSEKNKKKNIP